MICIGTTWGKSACRDRTGTGGGCLDRRGGGLSSSGWNPTPKAKARQS